MANSWLRLWHDMPNDPKWRTIARASLQPISLVQAIYLHILVDASRNVTRGHTDVTAEDLASALDVTEDEIQAVLDAMQGRVIDGDRLTGWDSRQPKREDMGSDETGAKSSAERKREQRLREKEARNLDDVTKSHDASRNVTTDKDEDKEEITTKEKDSSTQPFVAAKTEKSVLSVQPIEPKKQNHERGGRLPKDWALPKQWGEWALSEFHDWTPDFVRLEAEKFRDYWCAKAGKDASKLDWLATWRNWCRTAHKHKPQQARASPQPNKQEALEARNRAVATQWIAEQTGKVVEKEEVYYA